jgi:hypothetical protein
MTGPTVPTSALIPTPIPPAVIKELRHLMASVIADAKAYEVPGLCRRLNLGDGDEQEAFASKYKYAQKRLVEVLADQVVASARQLAAQEDNFELDEQLAKIDELKGQVVTTLTRRRLVALFDVVPLSCEIDEIELVRGVWPIGLLRPPSGSQVATLEDFLLRQAFMNDRLQPRDLEVLGLLTCSRSQLFKFLEAVTAPDARVGPEQITLAAEIDALLRHDGYTLAPAGRISGSPFYAVRRAPAGSPADESISATLAAFDPTQVHARWTMAMERRASDPAGAITLARTLLEDVCKWILDHGRDLAGGRRSAGALPQARESLEARARRSHRAGLQTDSWELPIHRRVAGCLAKQIERRS